MKPRQRQAAILEHLQKQGQRLSLPYIATQRCLWQDNWYTSGKSTLVLSY